MYGRDVCHARIQKKNFGGGGSKSMFAKGPKTYFSSFNYVNLRNLHFPGVGEGSGPPPPDPHMLGMPTGICLQS